MQIRRYLSRSLLIALTGVILAACAAPVTSVPTPQPGTAIPTVIAPPTTIPPTTIPPTTIPPTAVPVFNPTIAFSPEAGSAGTPITVSGTGYRPGQRVVVRLGTPNPMGEVLVAAQAGEDGRWTAGFVFPSALPSGDPIPTQHIRLVVMDENNTALASAPFAYNADALSHAAAQALVQTLLTDWQQGKDVRPHLAQNLMQEVNAGRPLDQILKLPPIALEQFTVLPIELRPSEVFFVQAQLTFATFSETYTFELVAENNAWKIHGSNPAHSPGQTIPGFPSAEWQTLRSDDFSQDGVNETIYTMATTVQAQARFNDDYLNSVAVTTKRLLIVQNETEGPLAHLRADETGIYARDQRLIDLSDKQVAAYLIAFDPGSGVLLTVIPLKADGSAATDSLPIVWMGSEHAFRFIAL